MPSAARALLTIVAAVAAAGWCAVLALAATAPHLTGRGALLDVLLPVAIVTVALLAILLAEAYRYAAWLESGAIVVRHWSGAKKWPLSSAEVTVRSLPGTVRLAVRDEASGRRVRLRLRGPGLRHAGILAEAIAASRPGNANARQAADNLMRAGRAGF